MLLTPKWKRLAWLSILIGKILLVAAIAYLGWAVIGPMLVAIRIHLQ